MNKIKSDKNVLFIYDKKIEKIVEDVFDELKLTGSNLIKIECDGDKLNKNEKLLFKILDVLLANNFTKEINSDLFWRRSNRRCFSAGK